MPSEWLQSQNSDCGYEHTRPVIADRSTIDRGTWLKVSHWRLATLRRHHFGIHKTFVSQTVHLRAGRL